MGVSPYVTVFIIRGRPGAIGDDELFRYDSTNGSRFTHVFDLLFGWRPAGPSDRLRFCGGIPLP
jgi:hypothetical protein